MAYKNKKKRNLNRITMKEISIVGTPAQEPALIAIAKSADEDIEMSKELEEQVKELQKSVDDANALVTKQTATIDRLAKVNAMMPDVRKYFDALGEAEQTEFLTKSVAVQEAEMQNAQLANAVVYKDRNSVEYRKQDDPRLVQMAKDADEQHKAIQKMQKDNENLVIMKMADEFKFLPGDEDARVALVKAVNGIEDEKLRKASFEILKSKNTSNSRMFQTHGITADGLGEVIQKAETDLDEMVEKHAKENKISKEAAYDAVLQTVEGAKLYEQMEGRLQ